MTVEALAVRGVETIDGDRSVRDAALQMGDKGVGCLVVVDERGAPEGILTDRDIAVRVTAPYGDAEEITVSEVMTPRPRTILRKEGLETALSLMKSAGCRRLPVVDGEGVLVGLLALDDIMDMLIERLNVVRKVLIQAGPSLGGP